MQISWHGLSAFSITTSTGKVVVTVVIDPNQNDTGLRFPRTLQADLLLTTHKWEDADNKEALSGEPFVIDMPGEFEVKVVFAHSFPWKKEGDKISHRIFFIESEGIHIAHLGDLNRVLTDAELEFLNSVDVLMLPVGGGRYLTPKQAVEVIGSIEPRIVIPYAFEVDGLKESLETVDAFCKSLGVCKREDVSKVKLIRKNLPEEEMMVYVLSRS